MDGNISQQTNRIVGGVVQRPNQVRGSFTPAKDAYQLAYEADPSIGTRQQWLAQINGEQPFVDDTIDGTGWGAAPFSVIEALGRAKDISYNLDGTVNVVTTDKGTKTMVYNPDGTLASIVGTGLYKTKVFSYTAGALTSIAVS